MSHQRQKIATMTGQLCARELRIKELEAESVRLCDEIVKLKEREQEHAKIIGMREGLSSVDQSEQSVSHSIQRRLKVLDACAQRWKECKEPICEAIYQGAAFELRLFADKLQAHQQALKEARVALDMAKPKRAEWLSEEDFRHYREAWVKANATISSLLGSKGDSHV